MIRHRKKRFLRIAFIRILFWLVPAVALFLSQRAFAGTYVYYGNRLCAKSEYKQLVRALSAGRGINEIFSLPISVDAEDVGEVIQNDYPRLFWVNNLASFQVGDGKTLYTVREEWDGAYSRRAVFNTKVKAALRQIKKSCQGKSKAQKAKIAFAWVIKNCAYKASQYDQTAYGVFVKKKAVCTGYARAYKLILDELGITCICVEGLLVNSGGGETHMANYVKLGGEWYFTDVTNGDIGRKPFYDLFLSGSSNAVADIRITRSFYVPTPALSAAKYKIKREKYHNIGVSDVYQFINLRI